MARPWSTLVTLLKDTQVCLRTFLTLLLNEEDALRAMDRQTLDEITYKKEQILGDLNRYDHQVQTSLGPIFRSTDSLKHLVEVERVSQPEASTISRQVEELRSLVESIRQQGKKNETLVSRMQHVVGQAIHLIYTGLGRGPVYQSSGGLHFPEAPGSVHISG